MSKTERIEYKHTEIERSLDRQHFYVLTKDGRFFCKTFEDAQKLVDYLIKEKFDSED